MAIPIRNLVAFRRAIWTMKPKHAGAYFLLSEEAGRWPALGGYLFDPFELDPEIPSGTYRIYFTSTQTSGIPLPTEDGRPSPDVEWQNPKGPVSTESEESALEAAEQLAGSEDLPEQAGGTTQQKVPVKTDDPAFRRHRREVEQERFARDIADSRLLLGQKMRHAGESAELLVVMRSYRTELEKATRLPMALSLEFMEAAKRSHAEYNAMFGDILKKNGELAKQLAELQKAQPPPAAPSLLAQIASPEGLSIAKFIAEIVTGRGGDADTVAATDEDPELKRLRKKRDEARAKLKRLQRTAGKRAKEAKKDTGSASKPKPAKKVKKPKKGSAKAASQDTKTEDQKQIPANKSAKKPRSRPIKGILTGGDGK